MNEIHERSAKARMIYFLYGCYPLTCNYHKIHESSWCAISILFFACAPITVQTTWGKTNIAFLELFNGETFVICAEFELACLKGEREKAISF